MSETEIEQIIIGLLLLEGPLHINRLVKRAGWSSALVKRAVALLRSKAIVLPVGRAVVEPRPQTLRHWKGLHLAILERIALLNDQNKRATAREISRGLNGSFWTVQTYIGQLTHLGALYPAGTVILSPQWRAARRRARR